jgi:hypothetical protein
MSRLLKKFRPTAPVVDEVENEKDGALAQTGAQTPGMATPGVGSVHADGYYPTFGSHPGSVNGMGYSSSQDSDLSLHQRQNAYEIMAETLFRYAQRERLFSDNPMVWNGVALRLAKGSFVCAPQHDPRLQPWIQALTILNVTVSRIAHTSTALRNAS